MWWLQSDVEDLDIAPAQTEEGFTFDSNVQMPDDGFQLWPQVRRLTYLSHLQCWKVGPSTSACAIAAQRSLLSDLCANQTNFSPIDLRLSLTLQRLWERFRQRRRFSVTFWTLSLPLVCVLVFNMASCCSQSWRMWCYVFVEKVFILLLLNCICRCHVSVGLCQMCVSCFCLNILCVPVTGIEISLLLCRITAFTSKCIYPELKLHITVAGVTC